MRIFCVILLLFCTFLLHAERLFPGVWKAEVRGTERPVQTENGEAEFSAEFPGGVLLYQERDRYRFKPDRRGFNSKKLSVSVKAEGCAHPLKAWIFVKDKDGAWFQSDREFSLKPGVWTRLSVRIANFFRKGTPPHGADSSLPESLPRAFRFTARGMIPHVFP